MLKSFQGVAARPARNVTLEALRLSSGHKGFPFTSGLSEARDAYLTAEYAEAADEAEPVRDEDDGVLDIGAQAAVGRPVRDAAAADRRNAGRGIHPVGSGLDVLRVEIEPDLEILALADPARPPELETVGDRRLRLVVDGRFRVAVPALVDPFFVLGIVRVGRADLIERPELGPVVFDVEKVAHEVLHVGDEVAVAAEELIVALAPVLLGAGVGDEDLIVRRRRPVELEHPSVLREAGVGQPVPHQLFGGQPEEPGHGGMGIDPAARTIIAHLAGRSADDQAELLGAVLSVDVGSIAPVGASRLDPEAAPELGRVGEGRHPGQELDAPAEGVAPVLGAVRPAEDFDGPEAEGIDEAHERGDSAPDGGRRVANAVDEGVDLVPGQAADVDAGDRGARLDQLKARLFQGHLGHGGPRPLQDLHGIDHVDGLGQRLGLLGRARGGRDRDLGPDGDDLEDDLEGRGGAGGDVDGGAAFDKAGIRDRQEIVSGSDLIEGEASFGVRPRPADDGLFSAQEGDAGPGDDLAAGVADDAGHGTLKGGRMRILLIESEVFGKGVNGKSQDRGQDGGRD